MARASRRPHPEEPERSEGVSKDGHESELAAMVRDGAHRSQVYAGCACYGAPPHHEAERVGSLILRRPAKPGPRRIDGDGQRARVRRTAPLQCASTASSNSATMLVILIIGFTAGPAVSL